MASTELTISLCLLTATAKLQLLLLYVNNNKTLFK